MEKFKKIIRIIVILFIAMTAMILLGIIGSNTSFAKGNDLGTEKTIAMELEQNEIIANETKNFLEGFYKNVLNKNIVAEKLTADTVQVLFKEIDDMYPTNMPIKGNIEISTYYKGSGRLYHEAIDIRSIVGTKVFSTISGYVKEVHYQDSSSMHGYGTYVVIANALFSAKFAHLGKILVKKNQLVNKDQLLATVGLTGNSRGVNLHFETIQNADMKDPLSYISKDTLMKNLIVKK
jgi:murein DD-endopeptidase MepM/ murein hydrolase activator NlpD